MKISKLILLAGIGALAYHLLKNKQNSSKPEEPGMLNKFVNKLGESISKPVDEVPDDINVTRRYKMQPGV